MKELGVLNEFGGVTNTYELCNDIEESDLFNDHSNFLNKLNMKITEDNKRLRNIYLLHKLHKKPTKARFIIAAPKCSINHCLNLLNHYLNYFLIKYILIMINVVIIPVLILSGLF